MPDRRKEQTNKEKISPFIREIPPFIRDNLPFSLYNV